MYRANDLRHHENQKREIIDLDSTMHAEIEKNGILATIATEELIDVAMVKLKTIWDTDDRVGLYQVQL